MLMDNLKKPKGPELDENTASQMLENIFTACDVEPNSVPLSVLSSYSNYRRERFLLQRILLIIILIFFCLVPLFFIAPDLSLDLKSGAPTGEPAYELIVDTFLPVSRITATIDGRNVSVYETADKTYSIEPTLNGTMTVTVTLKNKQASTITYDVTDVDTTAPVVITDKVKDEQVYLYLEDAASGLDFDNVTAVDTNGKQVEPVAYNKRESYVVFDYPETSLNIFVPDKAGNTLHLILTVQ